MSISEIFAWKQSARSSETQLCQLNAIPIYYNVFSLICCYRAEIEAIKKDLFEENPNHDKKSGLYFERIEIENDCTVKPVTFNPLKNFPTKPKSEKLENNLDDVNDGYVIDSLPKPKTKAKKKQLDDDSDYDPSDDVYYQDAEFGELCREYKLVLFTEGDRGW